MNPILKALLKICTIKNLFKIANLIHLRVNVVTLLQFFHLFVKFPRPGDIEGTFLWSSSPIATCPCLKHKQSRYTSYPRTQQANLAA